MSRQDAITAINRLHAANAEKDTIQLTDFLGAMKTTIVTNIVIETPAKNALTNDSCSATATMYLGLMFVILS